MVLRVVEISKSFGQVRALNNVSFDLNDGEALGVVGPNGAGKTVLLNILSGVYPPDKGHIDLGKRIRNWTISDFALNGIARTFQVPRVFPDLTVLDNVLMPIYARRKNVKNNEKEEIVRYALDLVGLAEKSNMKVKELSGGQKKLVEFARAISMQADVLLFDEPFAGVNPNIISEMINVISEQVRRRKLVILVSHEFGVLLNICKRIIVLHLGKKIADGPPEVVLKDQEVKHAFLGV